MYYSFFFLIAHRGTKKPFMRFCCGRFSEITDLSSLMLIKHRLNVPGCVESSGQLYSSWLVRFTHIPVSQMATEPAHALVESKTLRSA